MKHLHTYSGCCKYLQQPDFHSLASQIRNRWISVDLAPRISRMLLALACATKLPPEILGRSYCRVICRKMIVSRGNTALWLPEEAHLGFGLLIVMFALFEEPQDLANYCHPANEIRPRHVATQEGTVRMQLSSRQSVLSLVKLHNDPIPGDFQKSKARNVSTCLNCTKCPCYQASTPRRHP